MEKYTVFQKSDARIEITITTTNLIRIKYPLISFNYHLFSANVANFNKIHCTVFEHIGKFLFLSSIFKKLLLRNHVVDFVDICNVCARKAIIEAAKRILNSDKMCCSYSDLNFGITFFGTQCILGCMEVILQSFSSCQHEN